MVKERRTVLPACPSVPQERNNRVFITDKLQALPYRQSMLEIIYDNGAEETAQRKRGPVTCFFRLRFSEFIVIRLPNKYGLFV